LVTWAIRASVLDLADQQCITDICATLGSWTCSAPCVSASAPPGSPTGAFAPGANHLLGAAYSTNQIGYDVAWLRLNGRIDRREHSNT
jgi:hypothetical protein